MVKEIIVQFNKLQVLDSKIFAIETQLAKIPELLRESRERMEKLENEKSVAIASYDVEKAVLLEADKAHAEQTTHLDASQKKLSSVQNNKEYEAALKELDTLRRHILESEEKITTSKAKIEELTTLIASKTEEATIATTAYENEKNEKTIENKELYDELNSLNAERTKFANSVKKSDISKYERIRSARDNVAIAPVTAEVCCGCNMKIPPQLAVEVQREQELYQCPYCQRFLYSVKEESAVLEA